MPHSDLAYKVESVGFLFFRSIKNKECYLKFLTPREASVALLFIPFPEDRRKLALFAAKLCASVPAVAIRKLCPQATVSSKAVYVPPECASRYLKRLKGASKGVSAKRTERIMRIAEEMAYEALEEALEEAEESVGDVNAFADPQLTAEAVSAWARAVGVQPFVLVPAKPIGEPAERTAILKWKLERLAKRFERRRKTAKPIRSKTREIPPCIQRIKERAERGDNLSHEERLVLLFWWMNNVTQDVDELVDLFRRVPDFDEKKTRYYVEHALKKGYKPFGCEKIKALGLCPVSEGGCPIKRN